MDENYILKVSESKKCYHKSKAKILIELQKIDIEFYEKQKKRHKDDKFRMLWQIKT